MGCTSRKLPFGAFCDAPPAFRQIWRLQQQGAEPQPAGKQANSRILAEIWRKVDGASKKASKVGFPNVHPINFCSKSLIQSYYTIFCMSNPSLVCGSFSHTPTVLPLLKIHLWRQLPLDAVQTRNF